MEPVLYSPPAVLRGGLMLTLSLSVITQIPAAPDASGGRMDRKAHTPPLTSADNPHPPFQFWIGL
jgi:hypothetical protein